MAMRPSREQLTAFLLSYGEDNLASCAPSFSDDEIARIGRLASYYAWSEDAFALDSGMGGVRALCLATIDVIEGSDRELYLHHSEGEVKNFGLSSTPTAEERETDRVLRSRAAEKQRSSS